MSSSYSYTQFNAVPSNHIIVSFPSSSQENVIHTQLDKTITSLKAMLTSHVIDIEKARKKLSKIEILTPQCSDGISAAKVKTNLYTLERDYKIELDIIKKLAAKEINSGTVNFDNTKEFEIDISPQELGKMCAIRVIRSTAKLESREAKQKFLEEAEVTLKFQNFSRAETREFNGAFLKAITGANSRILLDLFLHFDLDDETKLDLIIKFYRANLDITAFFKTNLITALDLSKDSMILLSKEILGDPILTRRLPASSFLNALIFKIGENEAYKFCLEHASVKFIDYLEIPKVKHLLDSDLEFYQSFTNDLLGKNPSFLLNSLQYFLPSDPSLRESLLIELAMRLPDLLIDKLITLKLNDSSTYKALRICVEKASLDAAFGLERLNLDESVIDTLTDPMAVGLMSSRPQVIVHYLQNLKFPPFGKFRSRVAKAMIKNAPDIFVKNIAIFGYGGSFRVQIANLSNQRTVSLPSSSGPTSSSTPVDESHQSIEASLSAAYKDLFSDFVADCCNKYATPQVRQLINDFRNSDLTKIRYSKKESPFLPFGLALRKKKNLDIVVQIYAHANEYLGDGHYSAVKKSSKIQINATNQSVVTPGVVGRTKKGTNNKYILEGIKNHRLILKALKQKYPEKLIHIVPKINYQEYRTITNPKNHRVETFNTRYWGSFIKVGILDSADKPPIRGVRAVLNAFSQIAEAIGMMTELGYVHGDVKLDNILLDQEGRAFLHDFDYTQKMGVRQGVCSYFAWDHAAETGIVTPNSDLYGLVVNAARLVVPGLDKIFPFKNDDKSILYKKLSTSFIETFEECLMASTKLNMIKTLLELKKLSLQGAEWEKCLEDNFPIPFGMLKILKREVDNSLNLLKHLPCIARTPTSHEEWLSITKELNLTSPAKLQAEFMELCEKDKQHRLTQPPRPLLKMPPRV